MHARKMSLVGRYFFRRRYKQSLVEDAEVTGETHSCSSPDIDYSSYPA